MCNWKQNGRWNKMKQAPCTSAPMAVASDASGVASTTWEASEGAVGSGRLLKLTGSWIKKHNWTDNGIVLLRVGPFVTIAFQPSSCVHLEFMMSVLSSPLSMIANKAPAWQRPGWQESDHLRRSRPLIVIDCHWSLFHPSFILWWYK